jgi:hypothetical protein
MNSKQIINKKIKKSNDKIEEKHLKHVSKINQEEL